MLRSTLLLLASSFVVVAAGCGGGGSPAGRNGGNGGHAGTIGHTGGHAGSGLGGQAGAGQAGAGGATGGVGGGQAGSGGGAGAMGGQGGGTGGQAGGTGGQAGGGGGGQAGGGQAGGGGAGAGGTGGVAGSGGQAGGGGAAGSFVCPVPTGGAPATASDNVVFLPNVTVSTVAGGAADATALVNPVQLAIEPSGSLIVSDFDSDALVRVDLAGHITPLTSTPSFRRPYGLAYDATNDILYSETDSNPSQVHDTTTATVWRVDRTTGAPSTVKANLGGFRSLGILPNGKLVLPDRGNHVINLLDPATGTVTLLAGSSQCVGGALGTGAQAEFNSPYGVGVLPNGDLVVADDQLRVLRRVTLAGVVTNFAGDGGNGTIDGPAASARFVQPRGVAVDANGNVYVADIGSHRIRRVAADGTVTTVAGDGTRGFMDGTGAMAKFWGGEGVAVSSDGATVYVADGNAGLDTGGDAYNRIRAIHIP